MSKRAHRSRSCATGFDIRQALAWIAVLQDIEKCQRAIRQYEELGISFTLHDLEHRQMLKDAMEREKELRP